MNENFAGQMLGHMQWANQKLFDALSTIPDAALEFHAVHDDWTVAKIATHLAGVSGRLIARIEESAMPADPEVPKLASQMAELSALCHASDGRLIAAAQSPDQLCTFDLYGLTTTQMRSILLAQAVHHANEHRAQINGILADNNINVLNLDKLSLWYYNKVITD